MKVDTDVNMHNQEDIIGMEKDAFCVTEVCEPQVIYILK